MNNKKRAFTLTELLIALAIIGAIAAMCIPSLMNKINNNILCTQLKSITGAISQLASDQLIIYKTKTLKDTDFTDPAKLLSDKNFASASQCADAAVDCWKTSASGKDKVTYRSIKTKTDVTVTGPTMKSIVLKNGAILAYNTDSQAYGPDDKTIGFFCLDVNGPEPPNMKGRDYFCMHVTEKGKVISSPVTETNDISTNISTCISGGASNHCVAAIMKNSWKMPY